MNRHAYLILVHNEPNVLRALISQLDDPRNDIYLHVDKKADIRRFEGIRPTRSGFFMVPRRRVYWGDFSQVKAEYAALRCAVEHGGYSRYHLISGVDLALNSQDYIHHICDEEMADREFVGFTFDGQRDKIKKFSELRYFCDFAVRLKVVPIRKFFHAIQLASFAMQKLIGYQLRFPLELKGGQQWFSITDEFAHYLLENERLAFKMFRHVHCSDEMLVPTFAYNSRFRERLHLVAPGVACGMREIDWTRGSPYVWKKADVNYLLGSRAFFARKFSSADEELIAAVLEKTK